jgi:peptidoglycan/xylan/chitin deacetylase (PgdA/CDA1 family)
MISNVTTTSAEVKRHEGHCMTFSNDKSQKRRQVVLSFDDGPHPVWTPKLLDLLEPYNVHGVFFLNGKNVEDYPEIVERLIASGHMLGNHTYSHRMLLFANRAVLEKEIFRFGSHVREAFGYQMKCFRPPWGILPRSYKSIIEANGYNTLMWQVDAMDYALPVARDLYSILRDLRENPVTILMHDGVCKSPVLSRRHTLKMVERLLERKGSELHFTLPKL